MKRLFNLLGKAALVSMLAISPLALPSRDISAQEVREAVQQTTPLYSKQVVTNSSGAIESRVYYGTNHVMSVIEDHGALVIRPNPAGDDLSGWGASWCAQPFLQEAVLHGSTKTIVKTSKAGFSVKARGIVSSGADLRFGRWNSSMKFNYSSDSKLISGHGKYSVKLSRWLDSSTGDLNLGEIAGNYPQEVSGVEAVVDSPNGASKVLSWDPATQPSYFPSDITRCLSINANAPEDKPIMRLNYCSNFRKGIPLAFGAIYDADSQNVGITPRILNLYPAPPRALRFTVDFESEAN